MAAETDQDSKVGVDLLEAVTKEILVRNGDYYRDCCLESKLTTNDSGQPGAISFLASSCRRKT